MTRSTAWPLSFLPSSPAATFTFTLVQPPPLAHAGAGPNGRSDLAFDPFSALTLHPQPRRTVSSVEPTTFAYPSSPILSSANQVIVIFLTSSSQTLLVSWFLSPSAPLTWHTVILAEPSSLASELPSVAREKARNYGRGSLIDVQPQTVNERFARLPAMPLPVRECPHSLLKPPSMRVTLLHAHLHIPRPVWACAIFTASPPATVAEVSLHGPHL